MSAEEILVERQQIYDEQNCDAHAAVVGGGSSAFSCLNCKSPAHGVARCPVPACIGCGGRWKSCDPATGYHNALRCPQNPVVIPQMSRRIKSASGVANSRAENPYKGMARSSMSARRPSATPARQIYRAPVTSSLIDIKRVASQQYHTGPVKRGLSKTPFNATLAQIDEEEEVGEMEPMGGFDAHVAFQMCFGNLEQGATMTMSDIEESLPAQV